MKRILFTLLFLVALAGLTVNGQQQTTTGGTALTDVIGYVCTGN